MIELSIEKKSIQAKILQTERETLLQPGSASNDATEGYWLYQKGLAKLYLDESEREARENLYKQLTEFCRDGMLENGHVHCDYVRQQLMLHYAVCY